MLERERASFKIQSASNTIINGLFLLRNLLLITMKHVLAFLLAPTRPQRWVQMCAGCFWNCWEMYCYVMLTELRGTVAWVILSWPRSSESCHVWKCWQMSRKYRIQFMLDYLFIFFKCSGHRKGIRSTCNTRYIMTEDTVCYNTL